MKFFVKLGLVLLIIALSNISAESSEWFLMSRHGECIEIQALERKIPDMGDVDNPAAFIELMKHRGYEVKVTEMPESKGHAIQINLEEKGLHLLFAKELMCREFLKKYDKPKK